MFGDKVPAGEQKRDVMARVIDGLRTLGEHAKGSGVMVLLETHGDYTDSPTVVELMKGASGWSGMPITPSSPARSSRRRAGRS